MPVKGDADHHRDDRYAEWNADHVPDIMVVEGANDERDLIIEVKTASPLIHSAPTNSSIKRNGHLHAFGNTEDDLRTTVLGRDERVGDRPYDHDTGTGRVAAVKARPIRRRPVQEHPRHPRHR